MEQIISVWKNIFDFSNILNSSIAASWLVLAVVVLRFLLKRAPKWIHVVLWGLVAARLLIPCFIESVFSLIPSVHTVPQEMLRYEGTKLQEPAYLDVISNPIFSNDVSVELGQTVDCVQVHMMDMTFLWLVGIAILLLYTAISYLRLCFKVNTAVRYKDNIFQSENISSPFVLGIIKPKIYLPFKLTGQNLEHVVAHEQAHIRRKDHWWKPLGFLLLTIHWFNPLMWLAYMLLCRDIELACDEKVIKKLDNEQRADYTQALVSCSVNRRTIAACPLAFGEVGVKERVKSVMNYKRPAFWVMILAVIACVVVAVCFLTNPVEKKQDQSFLYYKNAISAVSEMDEVTAMYCPPTEEDADALIQMGAATGTDLAKALEQWEWKECSAPRKSLSSPGSVEFVVSEDYRIIVHQRKSRSLLQYAVVKYQDEVRYYRIGKEDYADAVALVHASEEIIQSFHTGKSKIYVYEKEGFYGDFVITLFENGTFSYYEGLASSYAGIGTWKQDGDIITLMDDEQMGYPLINYFTFDGENLIFMEEDSSNFIYVKVKDGERFCSKDEASTKDEELKESLSTEEMALQAYTDLLSGDRTLLSSAQMKQWWIPDFQAGVLEYEYSYMDLDGDGIVELLVQMVEEPTGYNGVFHFAEGQLFCWNSDGMEMSCRDYPLEDGTMVRQYDHSGAHSYTVFRYLPNGETETISFFFAREELIDESSTEPCPYYAIDGNEVDKDVFDERLKSIVTDRMLERSAWLKN